MPKTISAEKTKKFCEKKRLNDPDYKASESKRIAEIQKNQRTNMSEDELNKL